MKLALGLDTGGTYTDAAVLDYEKGTVLAIAKALTTRYDLTVGLVNAIEQVRGVDLSQVKLVGISTTLATNALVEGKGGRVGLLLIGYDPRLLSDFGLSQDLPLQDYYLIRGGHDVEGTEVEPLDLEAARRAILELRGRVDAFAVSGYFGVRNPAHERQVRHLIRELSASPVVCGHELSRELHCVKRATTAVLNARLLPTISRLLSAVARALEDMGIHAPRMVVKGDGTLVSEEVARERPIETILSGPAASVIGARYLAGRSEGIVVDMGGTTTDIALLEGARLRLSPKGAVVGGWKTCTQAADIHTFGIGGDSHITLDGGLRPALCVGPRRVVPLSLAAESHPSVLAALRRLGEDGDSRRAEESLDFFMRMRPPTDLELTPEERQLLEALDEPRPLAELAGVLGLRHSFLIPYKRLEELEVIGRIGLTPTDVLHAEGSFVVWDREAARLGVELLAKRMGTDTAALILEVKEAIRRKLALAILTHVAADAVDGTGIPGCDFCSLLVSKFLGGTAGSALQCDIRVTKPIIAVGAPAETYLPPVAEMLLTEAFVPSHAEVANAVGAVVGSVVVVVEVLIQPVLQDYAIAGFGVYLPDEKRDFRTLAEAVDYASARGQRLAVEEAQRAGAETPEVVVERDDVRVEDSVLLETRIKVTAMGRPRLAD